MTKLFCQTALLPQGWSEDVVLEIDAAGDIAAVAAGGGPKGCRRAQGPVVPGMPNLHSHAFQRAMAGLAETAGPGGDSFWSWRQVMYGFVERLGPEEVEAVAAQLYVEMLKAGYTAVGEFHYLHHAPDGRPYAEPTELSDRVIAAAKATGIGITHLPVLYAQGGFGGAPAGAAQRRFLTDAEGFLDIVSRLARRYGDDPQVGLGIAPHSLRAVTPALLAEAVEGFRSQVADGPIHIHVAEQTQEVEDCLAWSGERPVAWLLDHADIGDRWCLVHATHMSPAETEGLAKSGAVAGLCPTTEANLGDGLFPAPDYLGLGGRFGIGSDSHITVDPAQELRWLEYGQRLVHRGRNLLAGGAGRSTGGTLYRGALAGGAQALGRPVGALAPGHRADLLVLDAEAPALAGRRDDGLLDAWLFASNASPVRDVMVGGRFVIAERRHAREAEITAAYRAALARLEG